MVGTCLAGQATTFPFPRTLSKTTMNQTRRDNSLRSYETLYPVSSRAVDQLPRKRSFRDTVLYRKKVFRREPLREPFSYTSPQSHHPAGIMTHGTRLWLRLLSQVLIIALLEPIFPCRKSYKRIAIGLILIVPFSKSKLALFY